MLIDGRLSGDQRPIDRDNLPGPQNQRLSQLQLLEGDLDLVPFSAPNPDRGRLQLKEAEQIIPGLVFPNRPGLEHQPIENRSNRADRRIPPQPEVEAVDADQVNRPDFSCLFPLPIGQWVLGAGGQNSHGDRQRQEGGVEVAHQGQAEGHQSEAQSTIGYLLFRSQRDQVAVEKGLQLNPAGVSEEWIDSLLHQLLESLIDRGQPRNDLFLILLDSWLAELLERFEKGQGQPFGLLRVGPKMAIERRYGRLKFPMQLLPNRPRLLLDRRRLLSNLLDDLLELRPILLFEQSRLLLNLFPDLLRQFADLGQDLPLKLFPLVLDLSDPAPTVAVGFVGGRARIGMADVRANHAVPSPGQLIENPSDSTTIPIETCSKETHAPVHLPAKSKTQRGAASLFIQSSNRARRAASPRPVGPARPVLAPAAPHRLNSESEVVSRNPGKSKILVLGPERIISRSHRATLIPLNERTKWTWPSSDESEKWQPVMKHLPLTVAP